MAGLVVLAFAVVIVFLLIRILNLTDSARVPKIFAPKHPFVDKVLQSCPILFQRYCPPVIWGKSGHFQTVVGGFYGRRSPPELKGTLHDTQLGDGTVVTYEIFQPDKNSPSVDKQEQPTIVIVPGIANCTETKYVRTFAGYAISQGFRVAVLNHLGAKKEAGLSTPRIFTYGGTEELAAVVNHLTSVVKHTRLIGVGFSMGGNILIKYLGEEPSRQALFECAVSVCQGYDILRAKVLLHEWDGLRRFYNWAITQNVKSVIDRHVRVLFHGPDFACPHKSSIHQVRSSSSLVELDDAYIKKMAGFHHLDEFYAVNSSCNYINQIKIPVLLLNALDDPLVPEELFITPYNHVKLEKARALADLMSAQYPVSDQISLNPQKWAGIEGVVSREECNDAALFVVTHHGGHLGFYEGGLLTVSPLTWLDKAVMQYIIAVLKVKQSEENSSLLNEGKEYVVAS